MDTEENIEIQKAITQGRPPTDEGPYYHEPWWESYKGGNKGYLGGAIAYTTIGAVVGVATAAVLFVTGAVLAPAIVPIITGLTAAGMFYGLHEFHDIGKITGSGAAIAKKLEERGKDYLNQKLAPLEQKIDNLGAMVSGKKIDPTKETPAMPSAKSPETPNRTTHIGDHENGPVVFWKVAAIGLAVGLVAGALLAGGGLAGILLHSLGTAGMAIEGVSPWAIMVPAGLFGASFGINRDLFRRIFDKTDLWFKGIFSSDHDQTRQNSQLLDKSTESYKIHPVVTVMNPGIDDYPASTYHQDKYNMGVAERALRTLDPTRTSRH